MENNQFDVASLVMRLINQMVPDDTTDKARQKYLTYFMRILGARLQSTTFKDTESIKNMITRKLAASKAPRLGTPNLDLQRFEDLYKKFKKVKMNNKNSSLYVLYKICNLEQDSNNSVDLFQPILPVDDDSKDDENSMDVDEENISLVKDNRKLNCLQFLQSFRFRSKDVSEEVLYKDLLYVFQGIDGQNISFSILEDAFVLAPNVNVSPSIRKMISKMCELGWLYK